MIRRIRIDWIPRRKTSLDEWIVYNGEIYILSEIKISELVKDVHSHVPMLKDLYDSC